MVYLLVDLFNYRQLARLRRNILPGVEKRLAELYGSRKVRVLKIREGTALVECGREEEFDSRGCASLGLEIRDYLGSLREELFGFAVLLDAEAPVESDRIEEAMKDTASELEREQDLWVTLRALPLFKAHLTVEEGRQVCRVTGIKQPAPRKVEEEARTGWVRESLVQRTLDGLSPRLNGGEEVLFLSGPPGAGKTAVLREAARRLGAGDERAPLLRMYTLFRRRSPIHPFINSLSAQLLAEVPRYLHGAELAVWNDVSPLIAELGGEELSEGAGRTAFFPDHLQEDFSIGYQLYLLAFIRMSSTKLLPAFLACEGVEAYHPSARRLAARMISEMLAHPNFIPVLSSTSPQAPEEFRGFTLVPLSIHPLGEREIRSYARHLFPGLEIPETEARRLRRYTGGLYLPVSSCLQYLAKTSRIRGREGRFEWVQSSADAPPLPPNPLSVSWFLLRSLPEEALRLLSILYLTGGLLDQSGVLSLLSRAGFDEASIERIIAGFVSLGVVAEEEPFTPRIPALRRKLEELLGRDAEKLREEFISSIFSQWKRGEYPRRVLLFSFLAKAGKTSLALEVLPEIIRRKLDERDLAGARLFCEAERLEFAAPPDDGQKEEISLISGAGRLHAALLEGNLEDAALHFQALARPDRSGIAGEPAGDAALSRSLYSLACGDCPAAMDGLKTALLEFQESGFARGERRAYHLLGLTLLAEGRTSEAIEYFSLSERLSLKAGDGLGALRSEAFLAVCFFLEGRLTQSLQKAEHAEEAARACGQREQEIFLGFLRVKCLFQLGLYQECCTLLQACLSGATLYSADQAAAVLTAWLARSMLYKGDTACATRTLAALEKGREVLFFLAEAELFSGNLENASLCAERALTAASSSFFPPPEGVSWRDGFASVEGRCFRLIREDAFLRRGVRALAGCLLGMRGFTREAVRELHRLTRGEDSTGSDPHAFLHGYFYSLVLPEYASEEGDDKTTILSKSLKALQERASRIEAPAQKSAFLTSNYWNKRIMEDARQRKLI